MLSARSDGGSVTVAARSGGNTNFNARWHCTAMRPARNKHQTQDNSERCARANEMRVQMNTRTLRNAREDYVMNKIYATTVLLTLVAPLSAKADPVKVDPLLTTSVTSSGQPIVLPHGHVKVITSMYEVPPGAKLPEHKHNYPRYGYLLSGELRITNIETGKSVTYKPGDFIIESLGQWHKAENVGTDPIKLLVIDQVAKGQDNNTVLRKQHAVMRQD
jgi:quercetin dioxygenase-like cupin family protein